MEDYKKITTDSVSEMFLSIIVLLQNSLPCTENFMRYQKNFEKYMNPDEKKEGEGETQIKEVISPRLLSNSPLNSLAKNHGINFQPPSQGALLQYAVNNSGEEEKKGGEGGQMNLANMQTAKGVRAAKQARAAEASSMSAAGTDTVN